MANIFVKGLTFTSYIDGSTIHVTVYADNHWVVDKEFSAVTFTIETAENSILSEFNMFGLYVDGDVYKKEEPIPDTEEQESDYKEPAKPRTELKKHRESQETDLVTTESVNIENSEKVSKETKKEIQEDTNANNEKVSEAKPKLIIKIPKPFALGYWIIDLSKLLGKLLKGILAAVTALLLGLIASLLASLLQKLLDAGKNISQSDIDSELNKMDMEALLNQAQSEYDKQQSNLNSEIEVTGTNANDPNANKISDVYDKASKNKKNMSNKNKYSISKRNRDDILESDIVSERNGSNNRNLKLMKNPNYGVYLD